MLGKHNLKGVLGVPSQGTPFLRHSGWLCLAVETPLQALTNG